LPQDQSGDAGLDLTRLHLANTINAQPPRASRIGRGRGFLRALPLTGPARTAVAVVATLTVGRLVLAAMLPLAPDEAYYWIWSRALAPGYFDHPPMVALWVRAGTWIAGETPLGIRLLSPLSTAFGSALLWNTAEGLLPGRNAGPIAVLLLNATILFGAGAVLATPDAPLLFFWTLALWAMARIIAGGSGKWWFAVGAFTGLAFASKYTASVLGLGLLVWLTIAGRQWLRRPEVYGGAVLALGIVAPVLWWNAAHGWVSFLRQGGRLHAWSPVRAPQYLAELFAGQLALATPLIFLFLVAGAAFAVRAAWRRREPAWTLLAILSVLPALVFIQHAVGDRVQANWPAIAYPAAAIAATGLCGRFWHHWRLPAVALGLAMTAAVYLEAVFSPLPLPPKRDPIALQTVDWRGLAANVEAIRRRTGARFVAADNYGVAAELAHALPKNVPVIALGPRWTSFALPAPPVGSQTGILVEPQSHMARIGPPAQPIGTVVREQKGRVIQEFQLYRTVLDPSVGAALLPHPVTG
jgi:hypothetical protein